MLGIWTRQAVPVAVQSVLTELSELIYGKITDPSRSVENVTQWCKREGCWNSVQSIEYTLPSEFEDCLIGQDEMRTAVRDAKSDRRIEKDADAMTKVVEIQGTLSAAAFGAPQKRMRFVVMGVKKIMSEDINLPFGTYSEENFRTVEDAIKDIESVNTVIKVEEGASGVKLSPTLETISDLGKQLRDSDILYNHVSTETTPEALKRFKAIPQGGNFHSLPPELKTTYSDTERTQNTIYLRLKYNEPSGTVVNVRKSMWIHPVLHRALSIREAARLQTFPDSFIFCGVKDSQYQQVGNAVPPILAKALADHLCEFLDG